MNSPPASVQESSEWRRRKKEIMEANTPTSSNSAVIQLKDLHKSFREGRDQILKGVTIDFPAGKLTYILGPSGTGKSVTLKHILGLLHPDSGEVWVLGKQLSTLNHKELTVLREKFGMVFQNSALFDDMTIFDNVAFPLREHTKLSEAEITVKVEEILNTLEVAKPYDKYPNEISGGMRKRVGIARAIVRKPEILLYDEPTTGLDPGTRKTVDELIEKVKTTFKLTSIVISHDIPSALKLADKIIFLAEGVVQFEGLPKDFVHAKHESIRRFLDADLEAYQSLKIAEKN
jgi:phospholipid/cholesterol/gamma-HCH transport system ATP-binding protein